MSQFGGCDLLVTVTNRSLIDAVVGAQALCACAHGGHNGVRVDELGAQTERPGAGRDIMRAIACGGCVIHQLFEPVYLGERLGKAFFGTVEHAVGGHGAPQGMGQRVGAIRR